MENLLILQAIKIFIAIGSMLYLPELLKTLFQRKRSSAFRNPIVYGKPLYDQEKIERLRKEHLELEKRYQKSSRER